jgi:transaldolase
MSNQFSLWLDFIERDYLKNEFQKLLDEGVVTGATSNPSIFASAISNSPAYREQLETLKGKSAKEKYEALAIEDIKLCAKLLRPLYDRDQDGYISIEVDPLLSGDTKGTIEEAKRLFKAIGEPNVMIKIPATQAGYEAMATLMGDGISVNATLIFSPKQAKQALSAMVKGIENSDSNSKVEGVISVFVSRFDRLLDSELESCGITPSKTGIYNSAKIYNMIEKSGVDSIRTLFASTSVKGDNLPKDYYVTELVAPHSINTTPLDTIRAYLETNSNRAVLPIEDSIINGYFMNLEDNGFNMEEIYRELLDSGLKAFEESFKDMLEKLK